jgi:hypothetical protein
MPQQEDLNEKKSRDQSHKESEQDCDLRKEPPFPDVEGTGCAVNFYLSHLVVSVFFFILVHSSAVTLLRYLKGL